MFLVQVQEPHTQNSMSFLRAPTFHTPRHSSVNSFFGQLTHRLTSGYFSPLHPVQRSDIVHVSAYVWKSLIQRAVSLWFSASV